MDNYPLVYDPTGPIPFPRHTGQCQHCDRTIVETDEGWADPEATGDDAIWRFVCENHDTITAEHEPVGEYGCDRCGTYVPDGDGRYRDDDRICRTCVGE